MKILSIHNGINSSVSYFNNGKVLESVSEERFNKIKNFEGLPIISIKYIFKKYKLEEVIQAHKDLEGRKILGPAVIVPN